MLVARGTTAVYAAGIALLVTARFAQWMPAGALRTPESRGGGGGVALEPCRIPTLSSNAAVARLIREVETLRPDASAHEVVGYVLSSDCSESAPTGRAELVQEMVQFALAPSLVRQGFGGNAMVCAGCGATDLERMDRYGFRPKASTDHGFVLLTKAKR